MPFGASMMRAWLLGLILIAGCATRRDVVMQPVAPAAVDDATPGIDDDDIVHGNAMGSAVTAQVLFWGLWLPTGAVLALSALWTVVHRRRARREADAARPAPLRDGPAVVRGRVETDAGDAITVTITQRKRVVKGKNNHTSIYWDEKRREVDARPFRVRTESGGVVEVIPDKRVHLRDKIEAPEHVDDTTRRRFVRLRPGEQVWVSGVLSGARDVRSEGAYREARQAPVMKRGLSRMIVSTEAPGAHYTQRATAHRDWFGGVLVTLAVLHGTLLADVTLQILSGRAVTLDITRTTTWREWVKPKNSPGRWVRHCGVWARGARDQAEREHEVRCGFHACAEQGRCRTLPTQRAMLTGELLRDVGRGPTLHNVQAGIVSVAGWVTLLAYLWTLSSSRPWYAGGKFDEGP